MPRHIVRTSTSIRFYENQPNDICSHLSEKASKGKFIKPEKLQNHSNEEKEKEKKERARRRKGREEKKKKTMVALLVFIMATLEIGPFGDNVIKNPPTCIS